MSKLFSPSNANALFEALAWARAAKLTGFKSVKCRFLGLGHFAVEVM